MHKKIAVILLAVTLLLSFQACSIGGIISGGSSSTEDSGHFSQDLPDKYEVVFNLVEVTTPENPNNDLKSTIKEVKQTVVEVYISNDDNLICAGSGIVVAKGESENGVVKSFIATCHHIIEKASATDKVFITDAYGNNYFASLVGADPDNDICVLSINGDLPTARMIKNSDMVEIGEEVVAIGNPLDLPGGTVTKGIISATECKISVNGLEMNVMQTDASIDADNSGAGLFDTNGYLVGMINDNCLSIFNDSVHAISFVIPSNKLAEISGILIEHGYIPGKFLIGCTVANYYISHWGSQMYVYISSLNQQGCFYKSGLREGDILVSVSVKSPDTNEDYIYEVTTANEFTKFINSLDLKVGDRLVFRVRSGSTERYIPVVLEQYIYGVY